MTTYYSIYIPNKLDSDENDDIPLVSKQHVFNDLAEALKVLKVHKDGRLKIFKKYEEAKSFSQTGYEIVPKYADLKSPSAAAEKAAFRPPTKQQLIKFRKTIEEGNFDKVKEIIWENPRYLVNSGDTPTSLKDGYRYNALHICAINKKDKIAELILQTISTRSYIELLHGNKNSKTSQEVSDILLEYYLNMPEKGRSETPLHIAVKYGAVDVVEVLTTYPQCKMTPNLENMLPKDIICDRMYGAPFDLKEKIAKLLEERFYVPVIRSVDHSIPPIIGEPFSPKNPPELNTDPLSPEVEIQALAGPMSKDQAQNFRKRWKTPPRISNSSPSKNLSNNPFKTPTTRHSLTPVKASSLNGLKKFLFSDKIESTEDFENGNNDDNQSSVAANMERDTNVEDVVNNNGHISDVLPIENPVEFLKPKFLSHLTLLTPFRNNPRKRDLFLTYRDQPSTPVGLNDSSCSVELKDCIDSPAMNELNVKLTDPEKGLELLGRELAKEHQIEWKEYWDFLGCFIDIASGAGLQKLEEFFETRKIQEEEIKLKSSKKNKEEQLMNSLCNALDQLELYRENENKFLSGIKNNDKKCEKELNSNQFKNPSSPSTTPYLCIEKSLQVFAKRLTKTFLINVDKITTMNDSFLSELRKLKSLICSFKCDSRFLDVNFTFVHSRFANLISNFLKTSQEIDSNKLNKIQQNFKIILESRLKAMDNKNLINSPNSIEDFDKKEQLQCVTEFILNFLNDPELMIQPENLKTESICFQTWLNEKNCSCSWDSKILPKGSRKKRQELSEVSRRLFDSPIEQEKIIPIAQIETNLPTENLWNYRNNSTTDDNSDDDVFLSDYGSENDDDDDEYFTPPDSPSMLTLDLSDLDDYNNYVLGNEPTKRDLDLLNAIFHVDIYKDKYPNIYRWKAAVLKHPNEERDNFPSPSVIVKSKTDFKRKDNILYPKRILMSSPMRATYVPSALSNIESNENILHLRVSSTKTSETNSSATPTGYLSSPTSDTVNLSFLNVSEV